MLDDVQGAEWRLLAEGLLLRHQVGVIDVRILSVVDLGQLLLAEEIFLSGQRLRKYASWWRSRFELSGLWLLNRSLCCLSHVDVLCWGGEPLLRAFCSVARKFGIKVWLEWLSGNADHGEPSLVDCWVHQLYENSGGRFLSFLLVWPVAASDRFAAEKQFRVEAHQLVLFVLVNPKNVKVSYLHVLPGRDTLMVLARDVREEHELVSVRALDVLELHKRVRNVALIPQHFAELLEHL